MWHTKVKAVGEICHDMILEMQPIFAFIFDNKNRDWVELAVQKKLQKKIIYKMWQKPSVVA